MKTPAMLGFGLVITAVLTLGLRPAPLQAQGKYPDRPIRLVIPFAPGGGTDVMARRLGVNLTPVLGQQVVIENKAGAGGTIGTAEVARAKPDGYTLSIATSSTHTFTPLIMENPPYDPVKDFAHIAIIGINISVIFVHPTVAASLPELIKRVKAIPGKYSYGSTGTGGNAHLSGELFKKQAGGLDIVHVPYKGGGPSIQDVIAGQIPIAIGVLGATLAHHRAGKLRILAAFSEKRSNSAPDIPTAIELGVPEMVGYTFNILSAPAGTPRPIVDHLHRAMAKVMADEAFQKALEGIGMDPITDSNPEKAAQFVKKELANWAPIVKAIDIKSQSK